jgi:hypothetical protein
MLDQLPGNSPAAAPEVEDGLEVSGQVRIDELAGRVVIALRLGAPTRSRISGGGSGRPGADLHQRSIPVLELAPPLRLRAMVWLRRRLS